MKEECKDILKQYSKYCQARYLKPNSLQYLHCQKLIQEYHKCIELEKHLMSSKITIKKIYEKI